MTPHLTPDQTDEVLRRIAVLRGLYVDLADNLANFERRRELWTRVEAEPVELAKLMARTVPPAVET